MKLNEIGNYVERCAKGNIVELGCGENPIFNHSTKVDIISFNGYIQHDLNKFPWPFKDNEFDTIVALELILYIKNIDMFLSECKRILKSDGILILSTPNTN